ncbi:MAG: hypothetical protein FE78DRAFT_444754 [Acidomyces sp. 'richmondensis']|nr:MAG: hypothetical protein FE78DRAFT_444754 [Acidomyces sp. 'richmondensis']
MHIVCLPLTDSVAKIPACQCLMPALPLLTRRIKAVSIFKLWTVTLPTQPMDLSWRYFISSIVWSVCLCLLSWRKGC